MKRTKLLFLSALILVLGGLAGCGRSTVSTRFITPEFSLAALRGAPSLVVVAPEVRVRAYRKPYRSLFKDTASLTARISRSFSDSLKPKVSGAHASALPDSALLALLASTGAKHVIRIVSVTIEDTAEEIPDVLLPAISGMQPAGGGTSRGCIVTLEAEILDSALTRRYAFAARAKTDVVLYAYKSALLRALEAASRKAAAHLSGR